MSNPQGPRNFGNLQSGGWHSFLPPKCPIFTTSTSADFVGTKENSISREGLRTHQRTSSESFLLEEQPSWLDDLLNESEMPVRKGSHRRSSSDSFAYLDTSCISWNGDSLAQDDHKYRTSAAVPSWGPQEFDYLKDMQLASYYNDANSTGRTRSRGLEFSKKMATYPSNSLPSAKDKLVLPGSSSATKKSDAFSSTLMEGQVKEGCSQDQVGSSDTKEGPQAKHSQSEMEARRAKHVVKGDKHSNSPRYQKAQGNLLKDLEYASFSTLLSWREMFRHCRQAEGLELSAQLQFLDQQNLILSLENKALKQQLDCLVHEHLVKCLQHETLGQEAARLRTLYHCQQQQQQQPPPTHRRSKSRDLDSQFANLSLKGNESSSGPGQLHI
ncbi:hypothetical protein C4D60_Mb09t00310 [Musa balbisiana]|uniref:BZIP domain-containing protein n=1 Tax=Musa balbisiana TaxID=52838 RepID=A0A4S8ID13_MUSBA|nr:hypothetical protein C4D60_Mb09t00310 [Musa balbisiana]